MISLHDFFVYLPFFITFAHTSMEASEELITWIYV